MKLERVINNYTHSIFIFNGHIFHIPLFAIFVCQGIYARHLLGNASAPDAAQFGQCVEPLAKLALQIAHRLVAVFIEM